MRISDVEHFLEFLGVSNKFKVIDKTKLCDFGAKFDKATFPQFLGNLPDEEDYEELDEMLQYDDWSIVIDYLLDRYDDDTLLEAYVATYGADIWVINKKNGQEYEICG
jgi:hypothetical protein